MHVLTSRSRNSASHRYHTATLVAWKSGSYWKRMLRPTPKPWRGRMRQSSGRKRRWTSRMLGTPAVSWLPSRLHQATRTWTRTLPSTPLGWREKGFRCYVTCVWHDWRCSSHLTTVGPSPMSSIVLATETSRDVHKVHLPYQGESTHRPATNPFVTSKSQIELPAAVCTASMYCLQIKCVSTQRPGPALPSCNSNSNLTI